MGKLCYIPNQYGYKIIGSWQSGSRLRGLFFIKMIARLHFRPRDCKKSDLAE